MYEFLKKNFTPWQDSNPGYFYLLCTKYDHNIFFAENWRTSPKIVTITLTPARCPFRYFPSQGEKTHIFATELRFPEELHKVDRLVTKLSAQEDIITHVRLFIQ
jgi:hypothetical protein